MRVSPAPRGRFLCLAAVLAVTGLAAVVNAQPVEDEEAPVPPQVQAAVDKALAWLAREQKSDGSWEQGGGSSTAVPALAVKAFLARGHVPGQGPYGEVLNKGIDYVLSVQKEEGLLSRGGNASMYEHGISTAMLGEAYGMVDDARKAKIEKSLAKAVKLILDAQKLETKTGAEHRGGWRYTPDARDSDISVTGWQLMGLRSAANCGATVPKEALEAGREYVRRCSVRGSGFTYMVKQRDPNPARTGTGILSLEMLGEHQSQEALWGGDFLLKHPLTDPNEGFYYYGVYYVSQALNQLGGKYWERGYPKLRDALLAGQNSQGYWPRGQGQEEQAGRAYRTSMAVLALCVPYKYLPLYQK
jgi:hypothetical protein